jgi:Ca-activated chloride channel family protein
MSFARPEWLWLVGALPLVVALAILLWRRRLRRVAAMFGERVLVERLGLGAASHLPKLRIALLLLAATSLGIAAAGPQWGQRRIEGRSNVRNIVLALDVSKSMLARDVEPSRLEQERLLARRLMRAMGSDRFGLVAFAGRAYVLSPLTTDHGALALFVDALDPDIVSYGGSALSAAIRQGTDLVRGDQPNPARPAVVVVTDGEALEQEAAVLEAADRASQLGVTIHTVGIGTPQGALVPDFDPRTGRAAGYVEDEDGERVVSRLGSELLREIAQRGGGSYVELAQSGATDQLIDALREVQAQQGSSGGRVERIDRAAWFLALALLALALEAWLERRPRARPQIVADSPVTVEV